MSKFKKILYWFMSAFVVCLIWNILKQFGIDGGIPAFLAFISTYYMYKRITTKANTANQTSTEPPHIDPAPITEEPAIEPIQMEEPISLTQKSIDNTIATHTTIESKRVPTITIVCSIISVVSIAACIYFGIQKNNLQKKYDDLYDSTNKLASIALQMQDDVEEYEYLCDLIKNNYVGYRRSDFYATKPIIILEEGKTGFVDVYHYYLFGTCKIDYELIGSSASVKVLGHDDTGYAETVSYAIKWIEPGISYINFTNNSGNDVLTVIVISK